MKIRTLGICSSQVMLQQDVPEFSPEVLAAILARYSRTDEGLDAIIKRVQILEAKHAEEDRVITDIFNLIDYGHQSIADLSPVVMSFEGISILQAYQIFRLCPQASGQETSTRYCKFSADGLILPYGPTPDDWSDLMRESFVYYQRVADWWTQALVTDPSLLKIPASTSEKVAQRLQRNFIFDRSRYWIPAAAQTGLGLIAPARTFIQLCQHLLSDVYGEGHLLGQLLRDQLDLVCPHLLKYAQASASRTAGLSSEFLRLSTMSHQEVIRSWQADDVDLSVFSPGTDEDVLVDQLSYHTNRYEYLGPELSRTYVRTSWSQISLGEIRDMNRHRTGSKYCPLIPRGFYGALDQARATGQDYSLISEAVDFGLKLSLRAKLRLELKDPNFIYFLLLGSTFFFEHTMALDKFIYTVELRTGPGTHFRYAQHYRDACQLLLDANPKLSSRISLGSSEPEL